MSEAPLVSVLVPCFDLGAWVEEAVDSVLAQTVQDFEIVVVDDGSTDAATVRVLDELRRPRTRVVRTPNRGLPAARNHALSLTSGRYVVALDADDRLHPRFLEATTAVLEREPDVTFVSTWAECFGLEEWTWRPERCDLPALLAECVVLTASPVRREALVAAGGWSDDCPGDEDWDLWITLVERGGHGVILPEALFHYRQRPGSMRRVVSERPARLRNWDRLLEKHRASYERHVAEVLLLKERECGRLLRGNWRLELHLATRLEVEVAERRAELARLLDLGASGPSGSSPPAAGDAPAQRIAELERALARADHEAAALRSSWSWRLTAPVRRALDRLRGRP